MRIENADILNDIRQSGLRKILPGKPRLTVGLDTCGIGNGARAVLDALRAEIARRAIDADVVPVGCFGFCSAEPIVSFHLPEHPLLLLHAVTPDDVPEIAEAALAGRAPATRTLCRIERWDHLTAQIHFGSGWEHAPPWNEIPFFKGQKKIVLRNCGLINPTDIDEYIAVGGYQALLRAMEMPGPEAVIEEIRKSKLRGRGGAGFPTGNKWALLRRAEAEKKYLICNADEGDPGAFMNRNEIESDPHMLIEGMLIGAHATGATRGIVYLRAEYPLAVERLAHAIDEARARGLLGRSILGTSLEFDLQLVEGAGAFVCGEETALIASLEGRAGRPRPRPPFPAQHGLWGCPTNINNVETWCNVPVIIARGATWFGETGTLNSSGTKVFSLVGKIRNTGLVEMPLGSPLKEILYEIGEGSPSGKRIKAVQTGGPSGGCIPARHFDAPVDYESLRELGAIMGSGGMVVMDDDTCMVDLARYFIEFSHSESCGKCVPCRVGLDQALGTLRKITAGHGTERDISALEELGQMIRECSLCGLGQTAPSPVLTTLRHFRREYEEHIRTRRCAAGACESLFLAPCENSCPLHMRVPSFLQILKEERPEDAALLVWLDNPLPASTGRICQHPCEERCRRADIDASINMREVHRHIADLLLDSVPAERLLARLASARLAPTGRRVAVAGAGPAGLSAAFYLHMLGHETTVFEAREEAGGMLRYALPEYRLPKAILRREIEILSRLGIRFAFGQAVGTRRLLEDLKAEHDALFLAVGTWKETLAGIPDEEAPGVWHAIHFLEQIARGGPPLIGNRAVVIGGGNAAVDSARTAARLGASVTVVYRRARADMPAIPEEIDDAVAEGVEFLFHAAPRRVLRSVEGRVDGIELSLTRPGEFDASGRRTPVPTGERARLDCTALIFATGERPDSQVFRAAGIRVRADDTIDADWVTYATDRPGIYAGGDLVTGASNISATMATGKDAARHIDLHLTGQDRLHLFLGTPDHGRVAPPRPPEGRRNESPRRDPALRRRDFSEVILGLDRTAALAECARCLRCDVADAPQPDPATDAHTHP